MKCEYAFSANTLKEFCLENIVWEVVVTYYIGADGFYGLNNKGKNYKEIKKL